MATKSTNAEWLAQVVEDTIDPELPICDPHHHLWEFKTERVAHRYLLDEILEDLNCGHNIVSTVFIECGSMIKTTGPVPMRMVGETEFVNGIAAMSAGGEYGKVRVAAGIVGHADLCQGTDIAEVLQAHLRAGGGRFRGIRHSATWDTSPEVTNARCEPPEHLYQQENFRAGFAQLAPNKMSFEGWCYHTQISELTELAQAFPDTTIILDHFGGPVGIGPYEGKLAENFAQWQTDITALARCENVVAKLGGINMELNGFGWHEKERPPTSEELMLATKPYYEHTIEQFGADRCMFESNFPVDMCTCSYNVLWNSFKLLTADYTADEKAKLYHDTANRIYRLDDPE